jgi:hypothetical protein
MAVYVDNAVFPWRGRRWAHLMADDLDELHAFAARLGLPRRAFQDQRSGAHYDIDTALRDRAGARGGPGLAQRRPGADARDHRQRPATVERPRRRNRRPRARLLIPNRRLSHHMPNRRRRPA